MQDAMLKRIMGIKDSRSKKGIYSRGAAVYKGATMHAHKGGGKQFGRPRKNAIARRLKLNG